MAMNRDPNLTTGESSTIHSDTSMPHTGMNTLDTSTTSYDRDASYARDTSYAGDSGRSNFLAYLIGGLVIALGLMAFLFYDGGSTTGRDVNTTSSTTPRLEAPATPTTPSRPAQ